MKRVVNAFGKRYGAPWTCIVLLSTTAIPLPAQTFTTLYTFSGGKGANPAASLIQAIDGDLYGTTESGGLRNNGTIFRITPGSNLRVVYRFCSQTGCTDGSYPLAGLIQARDGQFYGTTAAGGDNNSGTIFKITQDGKLTTLHVFCTQTGCADGATPLGSLVQGSNRGLLGATELGGANDYGTIFEIASDGTFTSLHSFDGDDGEGPAAGLVEATHGDFYGTTYYGGSHTDGTVFKISQDGTFTSVYNFCSESGCTDGIYPRAGLIQAGDGNLYGTTEQGGTNGAGTVFKITPQGKLTTIYSFCSQSGCADGRLPYGPLVQGTDGNLYGTTEYSGEHQAGTIFQITTSGALTTLYSFCSQSGCSDGAYPEAGMIQDTDGDFYGTTWNGGNNGGTLFRLSVGLGPFVKPQTTLGKIGARVVILGTDLASAGNVAFNGTPASFEVQSKSEITTSVPSGATSGPITVTTNNGTLSSNVPFQVRQ
jgi:uncharacterized repeat protein (TIGR03803 family)